MTEEEITIKIKADTSDFNTGMDEAVNKTEEFAEATEKASKSTKSFGSLSKMADKLSDAFQGFSGAKGEGKGLFSGLFDGLKGKFESVGMSAKLASAGAIGVIVAGVGLVGKLLTDLGKKLFSFTASLVKAYDTASYEKTMGKMNASITKMKTTLGAALKPLFEIMATVIGGIADAISGITEGLLIAVSYLMGMVGLSWMLTDSANSYADSMEEATAAADAGLASFDKLNTLDTSGMGDASQTERIKNMMAEAALAGDSLKNSIFDALDPMKHIASLFDGIDLQSKWNSFVDAGKKAWDMIVSAAQNVWKGIGDMIGGFFDSIFHIDFGGMFDGLLKAFKAVINTIAGIWNNTVANIGFSIDIPDWVPIFGGQSWGINTYGLKIPYLAKGTVADPNDPFLAVIGDNRREKEVVSPVSTIEDAVRNVMSETGTGSAKIELTVNLDGRKIARGTYDYIKGEARRRGESWQS